LRKILTIAVVILTALAMSGCSMNFSTGMEKSKFSLDGNTYKKWEVSLTDTSKLSYNVTAEGNPVDVLILDEPNYKLFKDNSEGYKALLDMLDMDVSGSFPAPGAGTYYFVVYNYGDATNTISCSLSW